MKQSIVVLIAMIFSVIGIVAVALAILYTTPASVTSDNTYIYFNTQLGSPRTIPLAEITPVPYNEDLLKNLLRTCGTSIGCKKYGHFLNRKLNLKMFLCLTGSKPKVAFKYKKQLYITDDWR